MTEEGRRAGLDFLDWDIDKALSKASLEMDFGGASDRGAERAEVWDDLERHPVPTLPGRSDVEAASRGVESVDKAFGVCCFSENTQSPLILSTLWSWKTHSPSDQDEQNLHGLSLEQILSDAACDTGGMGVPQGPALKLANKLISHGASG